MNTCQNVNCPNQGRITVQIFKGTGACSVDCKKALGWEPVTGDLVMLSSREALVLRQVRTNDKLKLAATPSPF